MCSSVVIVGGGVMGAATACFLSCDHGVKVTVLERDPSYARASSALSASSIRQQFGTRINIALSAWSLQFLQQAGDALACGPDRPHIGLVERGYLYLAAEPGAATLRARHMVQRDCGVAVSLLDAAQLSARFAWMYTQDLALGSLGLRGEGWFDGPALHAAFRRKAIACGARFVAGKASGFHTRGARVTGVRTADGQHLSADATVLAAGAWTAPLAAQLGLPIPVVPKKRDVFVLDSSASGMPDCPLVIDPSGVWFRPEGRGYIAGAPPRPASHGGPGDPDEPPLEVDHGLFDEVIWPVLAHRVPAFEALRVRSAWAGYYEMNTFDHNGLAGAIPEWDNAFIACGFSGHGMQQAPAVGSALAAQVAGGRSPAPALDDLSPRRWRQGRPLQEDAVI